MSSSVVYQLTDYIGDIMLQYTQELFAGPGQIATGNYPQTVLTVCGESESGNRLRFSGAGKGQQDALLVVDCQMSSKCQQLSARMLSRCQNNYHWRSTL